MASAFGRKKVAWMLAFYLAALDDPQDQEVFLRFYKERKSLMYQVAYNILKDPGLAEDAVHNAFLDILEQTAKLRELSDGQAKGFAIVVARNKAVNILRKEKVMRSWESWEELVEERLVTEIEVDESTHLYNQLPLRYAEVLQLRGLKFKPAEIAKILKRDVQTVYKQIARGKVLLGEILEKEGGYEWLLK